MSPSVIRRKAAILMSGATVLMTIACASSPSRLYVLSPIIASPQVAAADPGTAVAAASTAPMKRFSSGPLIGVSVTVPDYLNRLDIVERTSGNELKPIYSAQWGEDLAVTASRALADDLSALLPAADIIMLPSRSNRDIDYQLTLTLTSFESDSTGTSTLAGRWSIDDSSGTEIGGGRLLRSQSAKPGDYAAMAAAMSRNLADAGGEIAGALQRLNLPSTKKEQSKR